MKSKEVLDWFFVLVTNIFDPEIWAPDQNKSAPNENSQFKPGGRSQNYVTLWVEGSVVFTKNTHFRATFGNFDGIWAFFYQFWSFGEGGF